MSHVFYRKYDRELPCIARGEGAVLFDAAGKRYIDGCGGAMVCNIGHGVRAIGDAMAAQAQAVAYVNGTAFTSRPLEELAALLAAKAPGDLDLVYFLSSGSEAVEAALKLARQYHVERGEPQRSVVIAQTPGYHGNTLLALAASARPHYQALFAPWLTDVTLIDAPYPYRNAIADAGALEAAILQAGSDRVAAFIAEPIGGSSTGASVPPADYFAHVREICDRYGVLFVCDEVLTGAGRTGTYFAIEHFRDRSGGPIVPDIITMGKGLNGGYAPLSAVIVRTAIAECIIAAGGLMHAQTYSHHPLAAAASLAVQRYIEEHALVECAARSGAELGGRLAGLGVAGDGFAAAEIVGDVRGIGMLWAVELVADRATRRPFPRSAQVAALLVETAKARGLLLWPNTGHAGGGDGDLVMIAPPFTIGPDEMDELAALLRCAIADVHERVAALTARPTPEGARAS